MTCAKAVVNAAELGAEVAGASELQRRLGRSGEPAAVLQLGEAALAHVAQTAQSILGKSMAPAGTPEEKPEFYGRFSVGAFSSGQAAWGSQDRCLTPLGLHPCKDIRA
jgi:hypothetical protein